MGTIIVSVIIVAVLIIAMSVGVLLGRKPIAGSCGGLNKIGMKDSCDICGGNDDKCDDEQKKKKRKRMKNDVLAVQSTGFVDATKQKGK